MTDLKEIDATHLQEQCPAFKDGCPFAKVEEKQLVEAIEKCPEFKEGCPFKNAKSLDEVYEKLSHVPHAAGHESDLSGQKLIEMFKKMHDTSECLEGKLGDCPVFHKEQGCPFKSVRSDEGKHLVEPVESVGHGEHVIEELTNVDATHLQEQCPEQCHEGKHLVEPVESVGHGEHVIEELTNVNATRLQEQCPAFKDGCPFAKVEEKQLVEAIEKCPEFKEGCPFKNAKSLAEVYEKLSHIPHAAGHESDLSGQKLIEMFKKMHDTSECLEGKLGDCPVFHKEQGCPFKSVRSDEGKHLVEPVESVGHDEHVIEELTNVDATHLQEQCPAFKDGCPFAKVEEKQLAEAIEKCPEFKEGCPFKNAKSLAEVYEKLSHVPHAAGHESDLSGQKLIEMFKKMHDTSECLEGKLGDCPVFHKEQGCPFKSVRSDEGKHLVEPVESVGHDEHVIEELTNVDATHLQEQCPAFKDGCPFAKVEEKQLAEAIEKCPEFKEGCPFKNAKSLAEVYEKLSHVPHAAGHESDLSGQKLIEMFKKMHDTSECLEGKLGDCPVFHKEQGCPFKSVRSDEGKHLVEPVESVGHDEHVIEELTNVDATHLQEQCPAFKDGCPFAKVEEKQLVEAIEKCPEFKEGCPFKNAKSLAEVYEKLSHVPHAAGHESDLSGQKLIEMFKKMHDTSECLEETIGDCPVFHKDQGCPFKSVRSDDGEHLVEPVGSVVSHIRDCGPPSTSKGKVMTTEVNNAKETCPAFKPTCPFSTVSHTAGAFENAMKCPDFKDGCAFKDCKNISDIYLKLQEIPDLSKETGSHGEILRILKMVHEMCSELQDEIGDCPVFNTEMGCPFKTVCSDGKPMIEKLESYLISHALEEATENARESFEEELVLSSGVLLSKELKGGTKKIHRLAENSFFVKQILKGNVTPAAYKLMLSNLYFIYRAMEEESNKHKSHAQLQTTYFPRELHRTEEIVKDLEFFYGSDWESEIEPASTTKIYVERIRKLSEGDPLMLLAHEYTRYMGDLSGGQILKRILMKALRLSDNEGLKFYDFENIQNKKAFKNKYRTNLDALQLDSETADRFVDESIKAFELNIGLFNELSALCGYVSENVDTASETQSSPPGETKSSGDRCPFAIGQVKTTKREMTQEAPTTETVAEMDTHHGNGRSGIVFVIAGISIALFAIFYAWVLA